MFINSINAVTMYVDAVYFYRSSSVVSLSVCHDREPCKNDCTDRDAVWVEDSSGLREPCTRWGCRYPIGRGNFLGKKSPLYVQGLSAVSCARTAEPIDLPFGSWTRVR